MMQRFARKALQPVLTALAMAMVLVAPLSAQSTPPAAPPVSAPVNPVPLPVAPAPANPAPVSPPAAVSTPPQPVAPAAAAPASGSPVAPVQAAPPSAPVPVPPLAEPGKGVDSAGKVMEISARPVLRLKGKSTWDDGFDTLKKTLSALDAEVKKLGLATDGQPMAHFVDSDDNGFTFEALMPLKEALAAGVTLSPGVDSTLSPAGKAVVFQHKGAYDDIDSAYEAFTAWLDDKGLVSTGRFLEEYTFWPEKSDDTGMKLKISVFLK